MTFDLRHGDCLEIMGSLPDASVDLILCDLPYGTTACKWDAVIPFDALWTQYRRVAKRNAAIVLTASQPFTTALIASNLRDFKYEIVWDKVNRHTGYGNAAFMPLKRHENVCVFVPEGRPTYNPQYTQGEPYVAKRSGRIAPVYEGGGLYPKDGASDGRRHPVSIVQVKADVKSEMGIHPTQKPVALMEYLIRTYSLEGDTVLDNCMGSGTTGVACANTGRGFIGIERDDKYFAIAQERIANAYGQRSAA